MATVGAVLSGRLPLCTPFPRSPLLLKACAGKAGWVGRQAEDSLALWALEAVLSCHPYLSSQCLGLGVWLRLLKSLRVTLILGHVTVNFLVSVSGTEKIFVGKEKKQSNKMQQMQTPLSPMTGVLG